jgi:uncharacterized membrane protein YphA (DoxX/SURF4 family)
VQFISHLFQSCENCRMGFLKNVCVVFGLLVVTMSGSKAVTGEQVHSY